MIGTILKYNFLKQLSSIYSIKISKGLTRILILIKLNCKKYLNEDYILT